MKMALVGNEVVEAGENAPRVAKCACCYEAVDLRYRASGNSLTWYWRHAQMAPVTCESRSVSSPRLMTPDLSAGLDEVPVTQRIALEAARNHIKIKPLDVKTDSMDVIRSYFTDLEFMPVESSLLGNSQLTMLGGRYCSIQSIPAAQLRISAPRTDGLQTLYQTEYRKDVFGPMPVLENGDDPAIVNTKGITVHIWVEKGLLFALTEEEN